MSGNGNGIVREHMFEMKHEGAKKHVLFAMDGSDDADYAFHCKFLFLFVPECMLNSLLVLTIYQMNHIIDRNMFCS